MDLRELTTLAATYVNTSPQNYVSADYALSPDLAGLRMYEAPILACADAVDPIFQDFKQAECFPYFLTPDEWLPGCRSVISYFLPHTKVVVESNSRDPKEPSDLWLHARIEGQTFINSLTRYLIDTLTKTGTDCMSPPFDSRFVIVKSPEGGPGGKSLYTSSWSERHVAYAAGLGTFGLSTGLITTKGVAGRFGSLLTTAVFQPTPRPYSDLFEYCHRCGLCVNRCPAGAISLKHGKSHSLCNKFIDEIENRHYPRYGCAKCYMQTPCTFAPAPAFQSTVLGE